MTEPAPIYTAPPRVDPPPDVPPVTPQPSLWLIYLQRRREALIIELRALDRALGRPQTIPERTR